MIKKLRKHTKFRYYIPMMITYICVLFAMNVFVFGQFAKYFPIEKNTLYYTILLISVILPPVLIIIEKLKPRFFTRILYSFAMTGGGINFIVFSVILLNWTLSIFIQIPNSLSQLGLIILPAAISAYSVINATNLYNKKFTVRIDGVKERMKFVHLSDIHLGTVRNEEFLSRIVRRTNNLNPDAVFITGDLIDNNSKINKDMLQEIDNFRSPVYFVNGNHEEYEGYADVNEKLSRTKMIILRNEMKTFKGIQIIGVDHNKKHRENLKKALDSIRFNKNKPTILLHHVPKGTHIAEERGIDLMLSGHTHNGQIIPFNLLVKTAYKYIHGLYRIGNMRLHTSAGTGTWGPILRLGSNNEITLIEVIPSAKKQENN